MKPFPRLLALVAAATVTADAALALSCMKPDAVRLYTQARDSSDLYAIVIGQLQPDAEIAIPEPNPDGSGELELSETTRVRMSGHVLGESGFARMFDREVDVRVTCLSIWCGAPDPYAGSTAISCHADPCCGREMTRVKVCGQGRNATPTSQNFADCPEPEGLGDGLGLWAASW